MNNSVLKGNVAHNNVLNMAQHGKCMRCLETTLLAQFSFFYVFLTNIDHSENSKLLHVTFFRDTVSSIRKRGFWSTLTKSGFSATTTAPLQNTPKTQN